MCQEMNPSVQQWLSNWCVFWTSRWTSVCPFAVVLSSSSSSSAATFLYNFIFLTFSFPRSPFSWTIYLSVCPCVYLHPPHVCVCACIFACKSVCVCVWKCSHYGGYKKAGQVLVERSRHNDQSLPHLCNQRGEGREEWAGEDERGWVCLLQYGPQATSVSFFWCWIPTKMAHFTAWCVLRSQNDKNVKDWMSVHHCFLAVNHIKLTLHLLAVCLGFKPRL